MAGRSRGQAEQLAFEKVLDAEINEGDTEYRYNVESVLPNAYGYFLESPGIPPNVRIDKLPTGYLAATPVGNGRADATTVLITPDAIDKGYANPVYLAHIFVHEVAHYLRWSNNRLMDNDEKDILARTQMERLWQDPYWQDRVPYEGEMAEFIVFGSTLDDIQ